MNSIRRLQGFTLLELLIAMLLMALIAVLVGAGFQLTTRSWETVDQRSQAQGEAANIKHFLRQRFSRIADERIESTEEGALVQAFLGLETGALFTGWMRSANGDDRTAWIYIHFQESAGNGAQLMLQTAAFDRADEVDWQTLLQAFQSGDYPAYPLLQTPFESIRFSYLELHDSNREEWHEQWYDRYELPRLVRIHFRAEAESSVWQELIVVPQEYSYGIRNPA